MHTLWVNNSGKNTETLYCASTVCTYVRMYVCMYVLPYPVRPLFSIIAPYCIGLKRSVASAYSLRQSDPLHTQPCAGGYLNTIY